MEKYSFLMSVYAKVKTEELQLSIDSMINQTLKPDQIVIVLDGPVGVELTKMIEEYRKQYGEIFTIVPLSENHGLAFALDEGLKVCRNELVARMDSDDYSVPERCEKQVATFMNDPELVLLGACTKHFKDNINNILPLFKRRPYDMEGIKKCLRRNDPFAHPSVMFKKSCVLKCGGYDPELRRRQDYDLFSKMVNSYNYKAANLPEALIYFRAEDDYLKRNRNRESCLSRIKVQKRIYDRGECSLSDYLYIVLAMRVSMILPEGLYELIYSKVIK